MFLFNIILVFIIYYNVIHCKRETYLHFLTNTHCVHLTNSRQRKRCESVHSQGGFKMELLLEQSLDLTKLESKGDFNCPCCEILISPDDETKEVYSVLEAKVSDNVLETLMIQCNNCGIKIVLTGFSLLETE